MPRLALLLTPLLIAVLLGLFAGSCGATTNNLPSQPPGQAGTVELWSQASETAPCPTTAPQCSGFVTLTVNASGSYLINGTPQGTLPADQLGNITQLADLVVSGGAPAGTYSCPGGATPNATSSPTTRTLSLAPAPNGTLAIIYQTDSSNNTCFRGTNGDAKNEAALEVYFDNLLNQYASAT
jgi:hypothetical protein